MNNKILEMSIVSLKNGEKMIRIKDIEVSYRKNKVLDRLNIDFILGEFTFILGPNGAGKSTLLKTINGILKVDAGEIIIQNIPVNEWDEKRLAQQIAFIPQEFHMQFDYTVFEFLLMARYPWLNFWGNYQDKDYLIVEKCLKQLGLFGFKDRFFNQLSGGEKQRVLICRALVQETPYILMDESLSFLDINHQIEILQLLKKINDEENKTIIMISHNLNLSAEFADRIIFLKNGKIEASGTVKDIYTKAVLVKVFDVELSLIENPYTGIQNIIYKPENK